MTWTNGRRLATISATNDHAALSFTYDSDGLRLTKTVGTEVHKYTWQGSKLIAEQYGDTALEFFYDESGAPYALLVRDTASATPTEAWYYYVTNLQGDVMQILDSSGNTAASYTYNAWGKILNLNNSTSANIGDLNPIRYRGYYYDTETGLYYLKSRYYDPEICRFINADSFASTGQGFPGTNMFAYCNNNVASSFDPSGKVVVGIGTGVNAGFGVGGNAVIVHLWDDKGNEAVAIAGYYGAGTPDLSLTASFFYSSAEDIFQYLYSSSLSVGGSGGLAISVGGEFSSGTDLSGNSIWGLGGSIGFGAAPVEMHAGLTWGVLNELIMYNGKPVPENVSIGFFHDLPPEVQRLLQQQLGLPDARHPHRRHDTGRLVQ